MLVPYLQRPARSANPAHGETHGTRLGYIESRNSNPLHSPLTVYVESTSHRLPPVIPPEISQ